MRLLLVSPHPSTSFHLLAQAETEIRLTIRHFWPLGDSLIKILLWGTVTVATLLLSTECCRMTLRGKIKRWRMKVLQHRLV